MVYLQGHWGQFASEFASDVGVAAAEGPDDLPRPDARCAHASSDPPSSNAGDPSFPTERRESKPNLTTTEPKEAQQLECGSPRTGLRAVVLRSQIGERSDGGLERRPEIPCTLR